VDSRCPPERIRRSHSQDQLSNRGSDGWSSPPTCFRFRKAGPEFSGALPLPSDYCIRLNENQRVPPPN
jgi:hypothetical protein